MYITVHLWQKYLLLFLSNSMYVFISTDVYMCHCMLVTSIVFCTVFKCWRCVWYVVLSSLLFSHDLSMLVGCYASIPCLSLCSLGLKSLEYGQVTEMAFLNLRWDAVKVGRCRVKRETLGKVAK